MKVSKGLTCNKKTLVESIVMKISNESPELNDLTQEQLEQLSKIVITQKLTDELSDMVKISNIDYDTEKSLFIMTSSRTGSEYTQSSYYKSIRELEKFTKKNNINILLMTPGQGDDFIYSLKGSPNTKNLIISGVSSFYSYLERRYSVIKNPIRGTKSRPVKKPV